MKVMGCSLISDVYMVNIYSCLGLNFLLFLFRPRSLQLNPRLPPRMAKAPNPARRPNRCELKLLHVFEGFFFCCIVKFCRSVIQDKGFLNLICFLVPGSFLKTTNGPLVLFNCT